MNDRLRQDVVMAKEQMTFDASIASSTEETTSCRYICAGETGIASMIDAPQKPAFWDVTSLSEPLSRIARERIESAFRPSA